MTMAVRAKPKGKTVRVRTFRLLGFALFETARALQSGAGGPYAAASYGGRSSSQQQIRQAPDQFQQYQQYQPNHQQKQQQHQPHQQQHKQHQQHQQQAEQDRFREQGIAAQSTSGGEPVKPDDPPPLPQGWGELRAGDGRSYYVYYPTGAVQWQRPAPEPETTATDGDAAGGENGQPRPDREQQPLGGDRGSGGEGEDPQAGESEMSDAEREMDAGRTYGAVDASVGGGGEVGLSISQKGREVPGDSHLSGSWDRGLHSVSTSDSPTKQIGNAGVTPSPQQPPSGASSIAQQSSTPPFTPPFESSGASTASQQHQQQSPGSTQRSYECQSWGGGDGGTTTGAVASSATEQSQGRQPQGPIDSDGNRLPIWRMGDDRQIPGQPLQQQQQQQQQQHPAANHATLSQPWGDQVTQSRSRATEGSGPPLSAQEQPTANLGVREGAWRTVGQEPADQRPADTDRWSRGTQQHQPPGRPIRQQASARDDTGGVGRMESPGGSDPSPWTLQVRPTPHPASYPQQRQPGAPPSDGLAATMQQQQHQHGSRFERPNELESWGARGGHGAGGPRRPSGSYGGRGFNAGHEEGDGPREEPPPGWRGAVPTPGMERDLDGGRPGWRPPPSHGGGGTGYGAPASWDDGRYAGRGEAGTGGQALGNYGYFGRDGGEYYQGAPRGGQPVSQRNAMDDYGTFPMGSRALVPHNRRPPGTLVEVKEQGIQLVRGAWARILVGTGKTRAVLQDAKERAADVASTATYKIKNTVGSITSRVADVLEGDPNGMAGPYGQAPHDYYDSPSGPGGGHGLDERSWGGPGPSRYGENLQEDARGPSRPGTYQGGTGEGGRVYPGYYGSGPGVGGGYGSAGGGGGYGGAAGGGGYGGNAESRGQYAREQRGPASGGYRGSYQSLQGAGVTLEGSSGGDGGYGGQKSQALPQASYPPQGSPGTQEGERMMGAEASGMPARGNGVDQGFPTGQGGFFPYTTQQQQSRQPQQQQQQQQQQPRRPQGQGPAGGGADGGYWAQFF